MYVKNKLRRQANKHLFVTLHDKQKRVMVLLAYDLLFNSESRTSQRLFRKQREEIVQVVVIYCYEKICIFQEAIIAKSS